jgi:ribosomal protein L3 glutamine methyltransferase
VGVHVPITVAAFLRSAIRRLERSRLHFGHGTHNARDEAVYLLLHALRLDQDALRANMHRRLTTTEHRELTAMIMRRIRERAPAAYITGEAWLGEYCFYSDPRAIVPRSFIAELLRQGLRPWLRRPVRTVLDLCTGSGCLAVLLAKAFPHALIDASDLSAEALALARKNVARYRLKRRIRLVRSDLFSGLDTRRYDLIVSNPPYVKAASMRTMPPEYQHEPRMALAGGEDGLDLVRRILAEAAAHLVHEGLLVCEIGHNRRAVEKAFPTVPFVWLETSAGPNQVFLVEREQLPLTRGVSSSAKIARPPRAAQPRAVRARRTSRA